MSSRANPEVVDVLNIATGAGVRASSMVMDSQAAIRGNTCEVIMTETGLHDDAPAQYTGVWVLERFT